MAKLLKDCTSSHPYRVSSMAAFQAATTTAAFQAATTTDLTSFWTQHRIDRR
ncbi:hypothetical protein [Streptomyces longwoodensis]|uniref:hypothetical protein n=1 Tax=Streptomyces longwoodensis TaxID=68231 RepID=UPI003F4CE49C